MTNNLNDLLNQINSNKSSEEIESIEEQIKKLTLLKEEKEKEIQDSLRKKEIISDIEALVKKINSEVTQIGELYEELGEKLSKEELLQFVYNSLGGMNDSTTEPNELDFTEVNETLDLEATNSEPIIFDDDTPEKTIEDDTDLGIDFTSMDKYSQEEVINSDVEPNIEKEDKNDDLINDLVGVTNSGNESEEKKNY